MNMRDEIAMEKDEAIAEALATAGVCMFGKIQKYDSLFICSSLQLNLMLKRPWLRLEFKFSELANLAIPMLLTVLNKIFYGHS